MTEINSEVVEALNQPEKSMGLEIKKSQENLLSKIISLMNNNPNYKLLGALVMMLLNFSVCVIIANWLKHSSLVS